MGSRAGIAGFHLGTPSNATSNRSTRRLVLALLDSKSWQTFLFMGLCCPDLDFQFASVTAIVEFVTLWQYHNEP